MLKFFTLFFLMSSVVSFAGTLTIKVNQLANQTGQVALAIFQGPEGFPDKSSKAYRAVFIPVVKGATEVESNLDLPEGDYAVAVYLDKNLNRKLDTNLVGAPTERFGFSNNPRIGFSAPNFSECLFTIDAKAKKEIKINLIKLFP